MLQVRDISKRYGAVTAIRGVSFDAAPGRVLGLLGPNGSGKSTTVQIMTGLLPPSSGQVCFDGRPIEGDPIAYRSIVGYVPEEAHLYTYMTAPEYLTLVGRLRGIERRRLRARISALLELFHLEDARHSAMGAYSKGMRQKVLLAAALMHDPKIVVLDEPNSGLDVTSSLILRALILELARAGKVVVFSSHVLETVESVCAEVVILYDGRIVAHDSVERLRDLTRLPSLEQVFRKLAVDEDVDAVASRLMEAMSL